MITKQIGEENTSPITNMVDARIGKHPNWIGLKSLILYT
jgi:hypothetical protein